MTDAPWDNDPAVSATPAAAPAAATPDPDNSGTHTATYLDPQGRTVLTYTDDPEYLAATGQAKPAPAAPDTAQPPTSQVPAPLPASAPDATPWANDPVVTAAPSAGDAGTDTSLLGKYAPGLDAAIDHAVDSVTGGFASKARAAMDAVPDLIEKGPQAFSKKYSDNLTGLQTQLADQQANNPIESIGGGIAGGLAQGVFLPEAKAASLGMNVLKGAGMGAALGGADALGHARGGPLEEAAAVPLPALAGGALGGLVGGVLSPRTASVPAIVPHAPGATLADYAATGVDPILAVNGSNTAQRVGQMLKGMPLVGKPLVQAAARTGQQAQDAFEGLATKYGYEGDARAAGASINRVNQSNIDRAAEINQAAEQAVQQARSDASSGVQQIGQNYGQAAAPRTAGEGVQDAIQRFSRSGDEPLSLAAPSRATSFQSKAQGVYDKVFDRLDSEMAGKTDLPKEVRGVYASKIVGGSQIEAPKTQAVVSDILSRNQSPHAQELLTAPQVQRVAAAANDSKTLSFNDLRTLRTWIRYAQKNPELRQSIGDADLQRMEGALTSDIYSNADKLGSKESGSALRRADQFYRAGNDRINKSIAPFFKAASGESAFDRVISSASSGSSADAGRLLALRRSLRPAEWNDLVSSSIQRLGASPEGFDLGQFVKGYGKLSDEGRSILFRGRDNGKLGDALDDIVQRGKTALEAEPEKIEPDIHFGGRGVPTDQAAFEGVMRAAKERGLGGNPDAILALRKALPEEDWGNVASTVMRTMARASDTDKSFNFSQFSTNWGKMSDAGKEAIFGGAGREDDVAALNSLSRISESMKAAGKFYNHSNSSNHGIAAFALLEPLEEMGRHLLEGNVAHAAGSVAFPAIIGVAGHQAAKLLSSPKFAQRVLAASKTNDPRLIDGILARYAKDNPAIKTEMDQFRAMVMRKLITNGPKTVGADAIARSMRTDPTPSERTPQTTYAH